MRTLVDLSLRYSCYHADLSFQNDIVFTCTRALFLAISPVFKFVSIVPFKVE